MNVDSSIVCSIEYPSAFIAEPGTVCAELDDYFGLLVEESRQAWETMGEIPEGHQAEVVVQGDPPKASVTVKLMYRYNGYSISEGQECALLLTGFDPENDLPFPGYIYIPRIVIQSIGEEWYFEDEEDEDLGYTVTRVTFADGEVRSMLRQTWEPHPTERTSYVQALHRF